MLSMKNFLIKTGDAHSAVLGYEGENNSRTLQIKTTDDLTDFATVNLLIDTLDCGAMTVTTVGNFKVLSMILTAGMLGESGKKTCQLLMMDAEGTVIKKTNQFQMVVGMSNAIEGTVPDSPVIIIITDYIDDAINERVGDEILEGKINDWLDDHPEATTTVQDGSLTVNKFIKGALGYVTPEMFGATGDGLSDDTNAFKATLSYAANNGLTVKIPNNQYYLIENIFSDDSIITENEGIFPNKKPIVSKILKGELSATVEKIIFINDSNVISNGRALQSACYDSKNARIVCSFVAEDDSTASLIAFDETFENVLLSNEISIPSHFNDMAYNPRAHLIYVPARPSINTVYTIDPDTLSLVDTITVDFGAVIKRISYDTESNLIYLHGDSFLKIYDESFNLLHSVNYALSSFANDIGIDGDILLQSSVVYKSQFFFLWTLDGDFYPNAYITQLGYLNNINKINYQFTTSLATDEVEGMFVIGDELYVLSSSGRKLVLYAFNMLNVIKNRSESQTFMIESGADMNDIITEGVYICPISATAQSLVNCPTTVAFRLYVFPNGSGNYVMQIYTNNSGDIFVRSYRHDNRTWTDNGRCELIKTNGSSNGWNYRILNDNSFEAQISKSINVGSWTSEGSLYISETIQIPLPFDQSKISSYACVGNSSKSAFIQNIRISTGNVLFELISPKNTDTSATVRMILRGLVVSGTV